MIQRIQSIFLLLAGTAALLLFAFPFATVDQTQEVGLIFADYEYDLQDHLMLIILFTLAGVMSVLGIFAYNNRRLQMRLTVFSIIANFIGIVLGILYFMQSSSPVPAEEINDGFGLYLPIIAIVLNLLAYRYISKDEQLVNSMDRLR
ncbi:MAG: DUF4293 domain-containing protein [Saprospiraceae bacterium]|nr:DUF4293 domain-containing protein [Saprospiraceae bacterium]